MFIYGLILLSLLVQLGFWYLVFRKLINYQSIDQSSHPPVSVLICAKNEASNLKKFLPQILLQDYPCFEVVVIDDGSTDNSTSILADMSSKYPNLKYRSSGNSAPHLLGKKSALTQAINCASHDILLLTDADCYPSGDRWIREMAGGLGTDKDIVLGFSPYESGPHIINRFIRYETCLIAFQYLSLAIMGFPYMSVGRNVLYRKSFFEEVGGFEGIGHIASGDDDLLLQKRKKHNNVGIVFSPGSFMQTIPEISWQDFFRQKSRHLSAGFLYNPKLLLIVSLFSISHFVFFIGIFICLLFNFSTFFVLSLLVTRLLLQLPIYFPLFKKTESSDLVNSILLFDILFALLQPVYLLLALFGRRKKWI